jgi:hypothetical protein
VGAGATGKLVRFQGPACAIPEHQDLIAQMAESSSAYDRMTLQVERTAADLRAVLSHRDFKCLEEISAANQRAAAAESELQALRATIQAQTSRLLLRAAQDGAGSLPPQARGLASPSLWQQANSHAHSMGIEAAAKPFPGAALNRCQCPALGMEPLSSSSHGCRCCTAQI